MRTRNRGHRTETQDDNMAYSDDEYSHDGKSGKQNMPPKSTSTMKLRNKSAEKLVADKKDGLSNFVIQYSKRSYSFIYPPSKKLHEMPETKNIDTAAKTSVESSTFLTKKWSENLNTMLIDQSNSVKFASISIFIEKCRSIYHNCPPFLIITHVDQFSEWIDQIKYWTNQSIYICSNNKNERHDVNDLSLFFDQGPEDQFGVILISFNQFHTDPSVLLKFKWASVIFDDPEEVNDISVLDYHSRTLVLTEDEHRSDFEQEFLSVEKDSVFPESEIYHITPEAAASDGLFAETLVNCPMIQIQNEKYLQIIQDNKEFVSKLSENKGDAHEKTCGIIKFLRECGDHPSLVDSSIHSELISMSGKTSILSRLLSSQKTDKRKSILVASDENSKIIETMFSDNRVSYVCINTEDSKADVEEKVKQFESEDFSRVLLINPENMNYAVANTKSQTIISYDLSWTPVDSGSEIILWNAKVPNTQQYRLVTQDTIEQIMFEHFWFNRSQKPKSVENTKLCSFESALDVLRRALILAHKNLGVVRSPHRSILKDSKTVFYSDQTAFEISEYNWSDTYLEPPEKPLPPEEKPKTVRPLTPAQYWTHENLLDFLTYFPNFPWGKWSVYEKHNRPVPELIKLWVVFAKSLFKSLQNQNDFPHVLSLIKEHGKFDQKRFINSLSSWGQVFPLLNAEEVLTDIENWPTIESVCSDDFDSFSEIQIPKFDSEIPENELKKLIFSSSRDGLKTIPDEKRELFRQTIRKLQVAIKEKGILEKQNSKNSKNSKNSSKSHVSTSLSKEKASDMKKFDVSDHNKVINCLMSFGLPEKIEEFKEVADLSDFSDEKVTYYINSVIRYCQTNEDPKSLQIIGRIVKYHQQKIPKRLELFKKLRSIKSDIQTYSAEDIEFLQAVSSHGFNSSSLSPVLMSLFSGSPSEIKIHSKVKSLLEQTPVIVDKKLPENIESKLPLRLNDMQMLIKLGKIDEKSVNDFYVYPDGYEVHTISKQSNGESDVFWKCTINLTENGFIFTMSNLENDTIKFEGKSPDEVAEKYKKKLQMKGLKNITVDGHELFALNSPLLHKIFSQNSKIIPLGYKKRFFTSNLVLSSKYPEIGKFSKETDKSQNALEKPMTNIPVPPQQTQQHFKFQKKTFGNLQAPIVLDLSELEKSDQQRLTLGFSTNVNSNKKIVDCYSSWIDFSDWLP
ncbi:hypothetical protein TVAG_219240 [Trichomonas vaginalis G3]|uniref:Uncharacterized protein n=1 Tax=Trichomonas vaginalis (strain ATCC PRA-98 / G3) TaxID=412133 RepID=A2FKQ6_TRIV3|nr:helicase protein [Trichomonas vaginalis G3]EAX94518.1 hypothetical protein TVAG_219240 [Trichomonas vaginalis G3]KAI5501100.1 helicase protein [Trichomonas vaginalis G3]|eukprot:XP_001307448.1 hypothetical protein [Trichomonas vaginalis G3]